MSGHLELGPNQLPDIKRKVVLTGDEGCGRTSLLMVYVHNRFPEERISVEFDYVTNHQFDGKIVQIAYWDMVSRDDYDRLRQLNYLKSHAILIVFSVDSPDSLENIQEKWWPEVAHFCKGMPLIVVATKSDLRQDDNTRQRLSAQGQMPVTSEQGEEVAREIGAKYIECSAKTGSGVQEVFTLVLQESVKSKDTRRPKCVVI